MEKKEGEETEGMSHQLCKPSATKSGRHTKVKAWKVDGEPLKEQENETQLSTEMSEQEVKLFKRKMEELQKVSSHHIIIFWYGL